MNIHSELLAHLAIDENVFRRQPLIDHLLEVSKLSKDKGESIKLGNSCELIGLLHDFGKSSKLFQLYIRNEYIGKVNHSSAGAKILEIMGERVRQDYSIDSLLKTKGIKERVWDLYKEILQYPILAHHGLYDIIDSNFDYRTAIRLDYDKDGKYDFKVQGLILFEDLNEEYKKLNGKSIYDLYYDGFNEFVDIYKRLKKMASELSENIYKKKALNYYYGALIRLLLSILKDADIYDSSNYYRQYKDKVYSTDETNTIWREMGVAVEELYSRFKNKINKSDLDVVRTKLADDIYVFSKSENKGAYKLSMPVGSGKTYAALRFAISHSEKYHKSRIFYTTAFLSVLEQNAHSIKGVLGDEHVLEHHSNVTENFEVIRADEDRREYLSHEYLKESWEAPVILTTIVQLSNSMFKDKASNIRRFSKFIDSVIIIDEIQSLPSKAIYNFNLMTNFLTNIMNCTILHCTATQPNFDDSNSLKYPCIYGKGTNKTSIIDSDYSSEVFDRVDYYNLLGEDLDVTWNTEEVVEHVKGQLKVEQSALIVLNTKRAVEDLYNGMLEDDEIEDLVD